jgi:hypothetical protein
MRASQVSVAAEVEEDRVVPATSSAFVAEAGAAAVLEAQAGWVAREGTAAEDLSASS